MSGRGCESYGQPLGLGWVVCVCGVRLRPQRPAHFMPGCGALSALPGRVHACIRGVYMAALTLSVVRPTLPCMRGTKFRRRRSTGLSEGPRSHPASHSHGWGPSKSLTPGLPFPYQGRRMVPWSPVFCLQGPALRGSPRPRLTPWP